ncbi:MAG: DNA mismatch repair protein MutS2 [Kiritimatiellia bacterium]|jgi:DNA mismatch repair protein MutS2
MDLDKDTLIALDWPVILDALAGRARTPLGRHAVHRLAPMLDGREISACFDAVDELDALREAGHPITLGGIDDIRRQLVRAHKGEMLDGPDLRRVGATLGELRRLSWYLATHDETAPRLAALGDNILVDDVLADELEMAFEPSGELSSRAYPELGELRQRIQDLHGAIRDTLQSLLRSDELGDVLQDNFVTQRNDRYVLPIKSHAKRWDLGIVHGTSGSGATVYVEPKQVVALNNRLRIAEGELQVAERRILIRLSRDVGRSSEELIEGLGAVEAIDLHCMRRTLADDLKAVRPVIGSSGVVLLKQVRHPVLVLRGLDVVGNDLELRAEQPALVLSGPNAGGKTVSLKTVGLCALLVRIGCFLPADEGSRCDVFNTVLAAIGDAQTVEGDLSSFSGHLVVLGEMIRRAAPSALLLLDEIASGTDPSQGSALAHAVLERLLDAGPRVVVTTHFAKLKALPTLDPRFGAAAVEYADGRPTYRVVPGAHGESHALSIASQMGLDSALISRARELMGEGERSLADTLHALDVAQRKAADAARDAAAQARNLADRERSLAEREARLQARAKELEKKAAAAFLDRLRKAEQAIKGVVADLQANPSHRGVAAARSTVQALSHLAPSAPAPQLPPVVEGLKVGDRVVLRRMGGEGVIESLSGSKARVRTGSVTVGVALNLLSLAAPEQHEKVVQRKKSKSRSRPSRAKRAKVDGLRMAGNTVDLRGQRVEEAFASVEAFVDKAMMEGRDNIFILHGHGTGALKAAIRQWLPDCPGIRVWSPANEEQGGDAFTVAELS